MQINIFLIVYQLASKHFHHEEPGNELVWLQFRINPI